MKNPVKLTRDADVAIITIDNPPVNALSPGIPESITEAVNAAVADGDAKAIVMTGAGNTFIAGADIREFGKITNSEKLLVYLLPFLRVIEDSPKPIIMAIHGAAFGGGLETAMAGHYRVCTATAQLGQPEVKLGLIPGMGGTQRLPRLVGVSKAVEMCAFGEPLKALEAVEFGLVDRIITGDLLQGATAFAREVASSPIQKTRLRDEKLIGADPALFAKAHEQANKLRRLQRAPHAAIEAVAASTALPFEEACERERKLFIECLASSQSRALIHIFFGERTVSKIPGLRKDELPHEVKRAAIVGAGTMGGGIAMTYANAGIPVLLKEVAQDALDRGMTTIRDNYASTVGKGRLSQADAEKRLALIKPQLNYDGFEEVDIIVEAVFESMAVKKKVFSEMARVAGSDCVLATNTSSLDVDEIGSVTGRPELVIGTHFFSPANVMRLLELVRGTSTSDRTINTAMALAKRLGKVAVLARNAFGFIGNRMVVPYIREAQFLVEEGASVEQVNEALYNFGMPMGPLAMDDLAGLDVTHHIRQEAKHLDKPGMRRPLVPDLLYQLGRYGQKTGKGWSRYDEHRKAQADPEVSSLIENTARTAGIKRRDLSPEEIVERCIYALINEGARVLEEGVAVRAVDIDIVYVYGYGFPAWRGGPMFYADAIGPGNIRDQIELFKAEHGPQLWEPAPLLETLAQHGQTFEHWDRQHSV